MKRFAFESHDDGTVTLSLHFDPSSLGGLYVHAPGMQAIATLASESPAFAKYVKAQIRAAFERCVKTAESSEAAAS